jgi:hypothetical protein
MPFDAQLLTCSTSLAIIMSSVVSPLLLDLRKQPSALGPIYHLTSILFNNIPGLKAYPLCYQ